jgi:hypothetical protein
MSPEIPLDSPDDVLDVSWQCFAMTFDHEKDELTGWLNGVSGDRWLDNPKKDQLIVSAYNAYMQGHFAKVPGKQDGEDSSFPKDQYYNPPEGEPLRVSVLRESAEGRVELHEHPYTKIDFIMADLAVSRLTATKYLDELDQIGIVQKVKLGRDNYYINTDLYNLLSNVNHIKHV